MTKQRVMFLTAGMTVCLLAAIFLQMSPSQPVQAQQAQPPLVGPVGRFQIASFGLQQRETPGAYILDTQTGDVFQVVGKNAPEAIGSVARPQAKKYPRPGDVDGLIRQEHLQKKPLSTREGRSELKEPTQRVA